MSTRHRFNCDLLHGSGCGVGYPMFGHGWGGDYGGCRASATA
jgi:hypothetical protein